MDKKTKRQVINFGFFLRDIGINPEFIGHAVGNGLDSKALATEFAYIQFSLGRPGVVKGIYEEGLEPTRKLLKKLAKSWGVDISFGDTDREQAAKLELVRLKELEKYNRKRKKEMKRWVKAEE
jgi:hypothetical protein